MLRRLIPVIVFVLAIIGLWAVAAAAPAQVGTGHAADTTLPPHSFGVQVENRTNITPEVSALLNIGAQWARVTVRWDDIEPELRTPAEYHWEATDHLLSTVANLGIQPIVTVTGNPTWAGIAAPYTACGPIRPEYVSRFAAFMVALTQRYSAAPYHITNWELYNEPDNANPFRYAGLGGCWGSPANNQSLDYPERYARMLIAVYRAVKPVQPSARLWMGGLAYDFFFNECDQQGRCGAFQPDWLDRVLAELSRKAGPDFPAFDVFNFHYYPAFRYRWEDFGKDLIGKATYLRGELANFGIHNKPVAITEIGRPSCCVTTDFMEYSPKLTARYVPKVFARALAAGLGHVIWYTTLDNPLANYKYGLLNADGTEKEPSSYDAYAVAMEHLAGATYVGGIGGNPLREGYRFQKDGLETWVVWRIDYNLAARDEYPEPQPPTSVGMTAAVVQVTNYAGLFAYVVDGGDGDLDGQPNGEILFRVTEDVIFIRLNPPPTPMPTDTPTVTPTPTETPTPTVTPTIPIFTPQGFSYTPLLLKGLRLPPVVTPTPTRDPGFRPRLRMPVLGLARGLAWLP